MDTTQLKSIATDANRACRHGSYRVDWFDRNGQPRSMWFEKWSDAQDEASRRDGCVYGPLP